MIFQITFMIILLLGLTHKLWENTTDILLNNRFKKELLRQMLENGR